MPQIFGSASSRVRVRKGEMNVDSSSRRTLVAAIAIACLAQIGHSEIPSGWFVTGNAPWDYEVGLDEKVSYTGRSSAYIKGLKSPKSAGNLMQGFRADLYRGKRVRLSAYVKSFDIKGWAGLWMRVDGIISRGLSFDNMQDRPIKG